MEFVDFIHIRITKLVVKIVSNVGCQRLITQVINLWHVGTSSNDLNDFLFIRKVGIISSNLQSDVFSIKLTLSFLAMASCTLRSINF